MPLRILTKIRGDCHHWRFAPIHPKNLMQSLQFRYSVLDGIPYTGELSVLKKPCLCVSLLQVMQGKLYQVPSYRRDLKGSLREESKTIDTTVDVSQYFNFKYYRYTRSCWYANPLYIQSIYLCWNIQIFNKIVVIHRVRLNCWELKM